MMTSAGGNGGTWLHDDVETSCSTQLDDRRAGGSPMLDDGVRASSCSRLKDSKAGGRGLFFLGFFTAPRPLSMASLCGSCALRVQAGSAAGKAKHTLEPEGRIRCVQEGAEVPKRAREARGSERETSWEEKMAMAW